MKINRIKIDHFGGLRDFRLEFSDGFNLVFGNNEDGKSTVLAFLRLMFYGDATSKSDLHINLRRRFTPFSGEKMGGEVEFTHEGRSYLLSKQFGKTPRSDKTVLLDTISGEPVAISGEIGERLFGMSCAEFERSIFISCFTPAEDGSVSISAKLTSLLYSGDDTDSYSEIRERLTSAAGNMHTSRKRGKTDLLAEKLKRLEDEKSRAEEKDKIRAEKQRLLEKNDMLLEDLTCRKRFTEERLEKSSKQEKAEEYRAELSRREQRALLQNEMGDITEDTLKTAEKLLKDAAENRTKSDAERRLLSGEERNEEYGDKLEEMLDKLTEAKAAVADAKKKVEQAESQPSTAKNTTFYFLAAVLFFGAAAAGSAASLVFLFMLLPGIVLLILGVSQAAKNKSAHTGTELLLLDSKRLLAAAEEEERRANDDYLILSERRRLALENREKAKAEREKMLEAADHRLSEAEALEASALALLNAEGGDANEIIRAYRDKLGRISALSDWLADSPYHRMTDNALRAILLAPVDEDLKSSEEYSRELKDLEGQINTAHAEGARLLSENESLLRSYRTIGVIENDIYEAKKALAEQEAHFDALSLAQKLLDEAYDDMRQNFAPELNRMTSELLNRLTDGKHSRATVSNDLALTVNEDGTVPFSAEFLSSGSADQAELCLRLAIARLTGGERHLPLLLDDVLMQYDDGRAEQATRFLSDYAKDNQVLLFTCHGSFREMAEKQKANIVNMK